MESPSSGSFADSEDEPAEEAPSGSEDELPPSSLPEVIPLAFSPPASFTVDGYEQDHEKTIYYLSDTYLDDVVITLEAKPEQDYLNGLTRISINDSPAYAVSTPTYHLLAFEKDDILYTMTCQYDINTLMSLGAEAI